MFVKPIVKKNQQNVDHVTGDKVPKSFVFSRGKLPASLKHLQMDLRKVMLPYTALNLKETKRNNMKDFLNVAGPMGVTHFLILSKTNTSPYLRVARTPQGPTLSFKIDKYSLATDIAQSQLHPRIFSRIPLWAGYGSESEADEEAATVSLPSELGRVNKASAKSAVKLQEIGPRMTLKLVKIEEGLCSGRVIFNEYGHTGDNKKQEKEDRQIHENEEENQDDDDGEEDADKEEHDEDVEEVKKGNDTN